MPITSKEIVRRQNYIGSSDVAALVGLDKFKTIYDLWLIKTGKVAEKESSKSAKSGTFLEEAILAYAEEELGAIKRNQRRAISNSLIRTNIDAIVVETGKPIEAKSSEFYGPDDWGDPGTDHVPDRVIIQCQVHIKALEQDICWVPAYLGRHRFAMYHVPRNDKIIAQLLETAEWFVQECIIPDKPPPDSIPSLRLIRKLIRVPNKVVNFDQASVDNFHYWEAAKEILKQAEKAEEICKARVLAAMGDSEAADLGEVGALTYLETSRKEYQVKASTYRTLQILPKGLPEPMKKLLLEKGENHAEKNQQSTELAGPTASSTDQGQNRGTEGPSAQ